MFFGGGTPSLLPGKDIETLLEALRKRFVFSADPEVTIECNPGTADPDQLLAYRRMGINRLSLGLQSSDGRQLALLEESIPGRISFSPTGRPEKRDSGISMWI